MFKIKSQGCVILFMFSDLNVLNEDSFSQLCLHLHLHLTRPTAASARLFHLESKSRLLGNLIFQESQAGRLEVLVH